MTFSPGAVRSGFTRKSTSVGPWLLKVEWTLETGDDAAVTGSCSDT